MIATFLIYDSYADWQESPIATSISTHSLDSLDFPKVTVCPPKGSHTALNHDLMRLDNDSITEEDRSVLKKAALDIFSKQPHLDYISSMLNAANPDYLEEIYQGFQEAPRPYDLNPGFEIFFMNIYALHFQVKLGKYCFAHCSPTVPLLL